MRVVFSRQAKDDLREITLFIARDNKERALSFLAELRTRALDIGNMPLAFPLVPRYEQFGIRRRPYGNDLIFYRVQDDGMFIVHIIHGARDYEAMLFPED